MATVEKFEVQNDKSVVLTRRLCGKGLKIFAAAMLGACLFFAGGSVAVGTENGSLKMEDAKKEVQDVLKGAFESLDASGKGKINVFVNRKENVVQEGDVVRVRCRARLSSGAHISLIGAEDSRRLEDYLVSGEAGKDGLERLVLAGDAVYAYGIGREILGMTPGGEKQISLAAEKAFGRGMESRVKSYPRIKTAPAQVTLKPDQYYKKYKNFPVLGATVEFIPYIRAKIHKIEERRVTIALMVEDGKRFQDDFGETVVDVDNGTGEITMTLFPKIGAYFKNGKIVAVEQDHFLVDYNHPLAGEDIQIDLTVMDINKPDRFGNNEITWMEDYGDALEISQTEQRPMVLMLYENGCRWCEKMFGGTFQDPWVRYFRDRFVWVKVNSGEDREFMEMFDQKGFPTVILLDAGGEVVKKLRGYKKPDVMRRELLDLANREQL